MALPTNVNYGTVVGQFLLAYADSNDSGSDPDGVPAKGSIFFRPSPAKILDSGASPNPVTILPAVVEATLDSEGYLCGYGTDRGIRLVATNDTDLNPTSWTWTVEFRLTAQDDTPVPISSFSIALPAGTTVDLTTVSPIPDANGTFYLTGPTGPANSLSIGTVSTLEPGQSATAAITGTAPSQTLSLGIPKGSAASISVGTVTTGAAGSSATVTNAGTSSAAVFNFSIPRGNTGATGPQGETGPQGPVGPTGATGIEWKGTWSNTTDYVNNDAVFYNNSSWFASGNPPVADIPSESSLYWFPLALQGATGATGSTGAAATIAVGTVTTGAAGSSVIVTNSGNSGAAVFDFTIPKGDTGSLGDLSATSPITYSSNTIGLNYNALVIDGGTA